MADTEASRNQTWLQTYHVFRQPQRNIQGRLQSLRLNALLMHSISVDVLLSQPINLKFHRVQLHCFVAAVRSRLRVLPTIHRLHSGDHKRHRVTVQVLCEENFGNPWETPKSRGIYQQTSSYSAGFHLLFGNEHAIKNLLPKSDQQVHVQNLVIRHKRVCRQSSLQTDHQNNGARLIWATTTGFKIFDWRNFWWTYFLAWWCRSDWQDGEH